MLEVTSAEYCDGYRLLVQFNNGEQGIVDLADALWGPMFEPLRDPHAFRRFQVSPILHTIQWENDADLAPEYLYEQMIRQSGDTAQKRACESGDDYELDGAGEVS